MIQKIKTTPRSQPWPCLYRYIIDVINENEAKSGNESDLFLRLNKHSTCIHISLTANVLCENFEPIHIHLTMDINVFSKWIACWFLLCSLHCTYKVAWVQTHTHTFIRDTVCMTCILFTSTRYLGKIYRLI